MVSSSRCQASTRTSTTGADGTAILVLRHARSSGGPVRQARKLPPCSISQVPGSGPAALVVLGVGAAMVAYLLVGNDDTTARHRSRLFHRPPSCNRRCLAIPARVVAQQELKAEASTSDHPIYWAGPRPGVRYEFTRSTDGRTYVRYLTDGAKVGDPNCRSFLRSRPIRRRGASTRSSRKRRRRGTRGSISLPAALPS